MNLSVGVPWFPPDFYEAFFVAKGFLALVATLLVIWHMDRTWDHVTHHGTPGQRLRYYTLLGYSVLVTGASAEQISDGQFVAYRHFGGLILTVLLIIAMIVSLREDFQRARQQSDT